MEKEINISEHSILVYEPDGGKRYPILYMHSSEESTSDDIWNLSNKNFILVCIQSTDWNKDMSPWPALKVFKGGEDFSGRADDYLAMLVSDIVPEVEKEISYELAGRGLIGYSLSGLFALYALYKTDIFNMIGSMSGSLWYEGWLNFMQTNLPKVQTPKIYISLGDKEKATRNERLATIENCTQQAEEVLRSQGSDVIFEMNAGNHFANVTERITKGIKWLIQ